jgi:hypothetical protein
MLAASGEELRAFTSVPIADTTPFTGDRFGDEWPFAAATAAQAGIRHHRPVEAAELAPMAAIQALLAIHREPSHAAGNAFWLLTLNRLAREAGCSVLLIGQSGNAGLTWAGSPWSQPLGYQWQRLGAREWLRQRALRSAPSAAVRRWRLRDFTFDGSALAPAAAERLQLKERMLADPDLLPAREALQERSWLLPGRSFVGALHAQMARAAGLEIRDPSADARLLAYTWSVPDAVFIDPETGEDRWLIRTAMQGQRTRSGALPATPRPPGGGPGGATAAGRHRGGSVPRRSGTFGPGPGPGRRWQSQGLLADGAAIRWRFVPAGEWLYTVKRADGRIILAVCKSSQAQLASQGDVLLPSSARLMHPLPRPTPAESAAAVASGKPQWRQPLVQRISLDITLADGGSISDGTNAENVG